MFQVCSTSVQQVLKNSQGEAQRKILCKQIGFQFNGMSLVVQQCTVAYRRLKKPTFSSSHYSPLTKGNRPDILATSRGVDSKALWTVQLTNSFSFSWQFNPLFFFLSRSKRWHFENKVELLKPGSCLPRQISSTLPTCWREEKIS